MRTTRKFQGTTVTVATDGKSWEIEVGGRRESARYLDAALKAALPNATQLQRDRLGVELLGWAAEVKSRDVV